MLRLTLEIVPFGDESLTRPIGMLHVGLQGVKIGDHGVELGQYNIYCYKETGELTEQFPVLDHDRAAGAWELIRRAVEAYCDKDLR